MSNEMYKEHILDHYENPYHQGTAARRAVDYDAREVRHAPIAHLDESDPPL
jgi:NifU-like protein involved in Fe-S cluster formation